MEFVNYSQFHTDRRNYGLEHAAKHTRDLGFDTVEWLESSHKNHVESAATAKEILAHYGFERIACYSVYMSLFEAGNAELEEHMKQHAEAAATLGSKYLHHTIFPPYDIRRVKNSYDEVLVKVLDIAEIVAKTCNSYGLTCLYEPQGVYFNGVERLGALFAEMKDRGCDVGICGDFGNSYYADTDPKDIFKAFADKIRHVHVKDYLYTDAEVTGLGSADITPLGKRIYEVETGKGSVDFGYGFRKLCEVGYNGAVSLEVKGTDEELKAALAYTKRIVTESGFIL